MAVLMTLTDEIVIHNDSSFFFFDSTEKKNWAQPEQELTVALKIVVTYANNSKLDGKIIVISNVWVWLLLIHFQLIEQTVLSGLIPAATNSNLNWMMIIKWSKLIAKHIS